MRRSLPSSYGCRLATYLEARRTILPHRQSGKAQNVKTRLHTGRRIPPLWPLVVTKFHFRIRAVAEGYHRVGLFPALAAKHPFNSIAGNNGYPRRQALCKARAGGSARARRKLNQRTRPDV